MRIEVFTQRHGDVVFTTRFSFVARLVTWFVRTLDYDYPVRPGESPRLTLVPARCAVGISRSGAGFRVFTVSDRYLGAVARIRGGWCYVCAHPCEQVSGAFRNRALAAVALRAHDAEVRARQTACSGE